MPSSPLAAARATACRHCQLTEPPTATGEAATADQPPLLLFSTQSRSLLSSSLPFSSPPKVPSNCRLLSSPAITHALPHATKIRHSFWPPPLAAAPDLPSSPSPLLPLRHCPRTHRASCRDPLLLPISRPPATTLRSSCPLTVARSRHCFTDAIAGHGVLQHRRLCRLFSAVHRPKPPRLPFLFSTSSFPLLPTRTDPKLSTSLLPHLLPRKHHRLPPPPFIHGLAHSSFTHAESLLMAAHASKPIGSPCRRHEPKLLHLPSFPNPLPATMVPYGLMLNRHPLSQSHPWLPPACCLFPSPFLLPITTISTFGLLLSSSAHCSEPQAI